MRMDRMSFAGMLGDAYELLMHAAYGLVPDSYDDNGDPETWREAGEGEAMHVAEEAFNQVAHQAIRLCACGRALDAVHGQLTSEQFRRDMDEHMRVEQELYDGFDARRLACAVELGLMEEDGDVD